MDPASSYDSQAASVLRGEYEGLVKLRGAGATTAIVRLRSPVSWSSSADHTVYTFHLRHGVTFHDGTPFTAEVVRASYTRELTLNQGPAFHHSARILQPKRDQGIYRNPSYDPVHPERALHHIFLAALTAQWGTNIISPTA